MEGNVTGYVYAAGVIDANAGDISGNSVTLRNQGKVTGDVTAALINGGSITSVTDNFVDIAGTVEGNVYTVNSSNGSVTGKVFGNNVGIENGNVTGDVYVFMADSANQIAVSGNNVYMVGATVGGNVAVALNPGNGSSRNQITLSGVTIEGRVGVILNEEEETDYQGKDNNIIVAGLNKVGSLEGFNSLFVTLAEDNQATASLTLTNSKTLNLQNVEIIVNSDATPRHAYKLFSFANGEGSLIFNSGTSIKDSTSIFVNEEWVLDTRGLTASEDGTYSLPLNNLVISDTGELAATNEAGDITHVLGKADLLPTSDAKTLSEGFLGTVAFVNQGGRVHCR